MWRSWRRLTGFRVTCFLVLRPRFRVLRLPPGSLIAPSPYNTNAATKFDNLIVGQVRDDRSSTPSTKISCYTHRHPVTYHRIGTSCEPRFWLSLIGRSGRLEERWESASFASTHCNRDKFSFQGHSLILTGRHPLFWTMSCYITRSNSWAFTYGVNNSIMIFSLQHEVQSINSNSHIQILTAQHLVCKPGPYGTVELPLNLSNVTYAPHRLVVVHEVTPQTQESVDMEPSSRKLP